MPVEAENARPVGSHKVDAFREKVVKIGAKAASVSQIRASKSESATLTPGVAAFLSIGPIRRQGGRKTGVAR